MAVADFAGLSSSHYRPSLTYSTIRSHDSGGVPEMLTQNPMLLDDLSRLGWPWTIVGPSTAASWSYSTEYLYSVPHPVATTGSLYFGAAHIPDNISTTPGFGTAGFMIDIVGIQGGLVGNSTSLQTTNLPTATLPTRVSGGEGVWMGLQYYTSIGSTDHTVTVTYTNQSGTGSRTSVVTMANTPANSAFYVLPLQPGDTGVRSVESVQLSASTGTAGNFGIVLFKPLFIVPQSQGYVNFADVAGWNTPIDDEAVLAFLYHWALLTTGGANAATFSFFEA